MNLHHRPQPPAATAPACSPRPQHTPPGRRLARRITRTITYAALRGAATTAGGAAVTAVIWWIHNH